MHKCILMAKISFVVTNGLILQLFKCIAFSESFQKCHSLSDVNGFCLLLYPPTYASLSPTSQFEVKNSPLWQDIPYARFVQVRTSLIQRVVLAKKGYMSPDEKCN